MENNKKQMTLDDLAVMVADGFNDVGNRIDKLDGRLEKVEGRMEKLDSRMEGLEGRVDKLENSVSGLRSSVNNYLDLSDTRYLELKHRVALLAQWVKVVADKAGVPVDLGQLDKVV